MAASQSSTYWDHLYSQVQGNYVRLELVAERSTGNPPRPAVCGVCRGRGLWGQSDWMWCPHLMLSQGTLADGRSFLGISFLLSRRDGNTSLLMREQVLLTRLPCCRHMAWGDCCITPIPPQGRVSMLSQFTGGETEAQSHTHKVMQLESRLPGFTPTPARLRHTTAPWPSWRSLGGSGVAVARGTL